VVNGLFGWKNGEGFEFNYELSITNYGFSINVEDRRPKKGDRRRETGDWRLETEDGRK